MSEKWKDIPGYEGLYQASTEGRIRTAPGKTTHTDRHGDRHWKTRILKGRGDNYATGKRVNLWKDGKPKDFLQARLVALVWVPGYAPELTVNHINGNRMDNRIENLEWISLADNVRHAFGIGLHDHRMKSVTLRKPGGVPIKFKSYASAERYFGLTNGRVHDAVKTIGKSLAAMR